MPTKNQCLIAAAQTLTTDLDVTKVIGLSEVGLKFNRGMYFLIDSKELQLSTKPNIENFYFQILFAQGNAGDDSQNLSGHRF